MLTKMDSFCRSLLFVIASVVCASNIHMIAAVNFDCDRSIATSSLFRHICAMPMGDWVNSHIGDLVDQTYRDVHAECNNNVNKLCNNLPELIKKYSAAGAEQCKEDLKNVLCEKLHEHTKGHGRTAYCSYLITVSHAMSISVEGWCNKIYEGYFQAYRDACFIGISDNSEKYRKGSQPESFCRLFKKNKDLETLIKTRTCKLVQGKLAKTYCHRVMLSGYA